MITAGIILLALSVIANADDGVDSTLALVGTILLIVGVNL